MSREPSAIFTVPAWLAWPSWLRDPPLTYQGCIGPSPLAKNASGTVDQPSGGGAELATPSALVWARPCRKVG